MPPPRRTVSTPMSERQQISLLIQMTASTSGNSTVSKLHPMRPRVLQPPSNILDLPRAHMKKAEHKKSDDLDEMNNSASGSGEKQQTQQQPEAQQQENTRTEKGVATGGTPNTTADEHSSSNTAPDSKKETNSEHTSSTSADVSSSNNTCKRPFSDIDEDEFEDSDDLKKKKRKDSESSSSKDNAGKAGSLTSNLRLPGRLEKSIKQAASAKGSPTAGGNKSATTATTTTSDKEPTEGNKAAAVATVHNSKTAYENEGGEDDEYKTSENMYSGGLKVPPLKIVIPQQNCSIDDGNASRTGKVSQSRNAALPYVVSSSNEANERDATASASTTNNLQLGSPHESPVKVNTNACSSGSNNNNNNNNSNVIDEKNVKLLNTEEKNLQRVLRSSHRTGGGGAAVGLERSSNNSSPQMQSSSPSPASSHNANEAMDGKVNFVHMTTSPTSQQQQSYDHEHIVNLPSPSTSSTSSSKDVHSATELHPRKRKIRTKHDDNHLKTATHGAAAAANAASTNAVAGSVDAAAATDAGAHPHDFPFTNCFQMYLNIRRQIEKKWKMVYPVKPRPPQGYSEYLLNKKTYLLSSTRSTNAAAVPPATVSPKMRDIFKIQETERQELTQRHVVEREKLCLNVEQEIIRVHSKAARNLASQSAPYSVCTLLKDEEVYNMITPEQEEKDRSARFRCNGRLLLSWLQDVDDKWEKIKEAMVLRHHNEAESLHAVQEMDWEIALKKYELCDYKSQLIVDKEHVPIVHVSEDFDLLPA